MRNKFAVFVLLVVVGVGSYMVGVGSVDECDCSMYMDITEPAVEVDGSGTLLEIGVMYEPADMDITEPAEDEDWDDDTPTAIEGEGLLLIADEDLCPTCPTFTCDRRHVACNSCCPEVIKIVEMPCIEEPYYPRVTPPCDPFDDVVDIWVDDDCDHQAGSLFELIDGKTVAACAK